MTIVYKRPKEETTFECENCHTVWQDSWLDPVGCGWCPFCFTENIPDRLVKLPAVPQKKMTFQLAEYIKDLKSR